MHMYMKLMEKDVMNLEESKGCILESLKGERGREKCDYIKISKRKEKIEVAKKIHQEII